MWVFYVYWCVWVLTDRDRETERQRDRETERQRHKDTKTQRHRETNTERQTHRARES